MDINGIIERTRNNMRNELLGATEDYNRCKQNNVDITTGRMKSLSDSIVNVRKTVLAASNKNIFIQNPFVYIN